MTGRGCSGDGDAADTRKEHAQSTVLCQNTQQLLGPTKGLRPRWMEVLLVLSGIFTLHCCQRLFLRFFSESVAGEKAEGNTNSHNFSLSHTHCFYTFLQGSLGWSHCLDGFLQQKLLKTVKKSSGKVNLSLRLC